MSDDVTVSIGLGFPVEAMAGVGRLPVKDVNEQEAARVFFMAAKWATQRLVFGVGMGSLEDVWPPQRLAILKLA